MIPTSHADLLERPLICDLATIRPDGHIQVNPMWFQFDGDHIRFSHTSTRAKYRNLMANPHMTVLIVDPDDTQRYLELRGRLREVVPDPTGSFHHVLAARYGDDDDSPPPQAAQRVVLVMQIDAVRPRDNPSVGHQPEP